MLFISRHAERLDKTLNLNIISHWASGDPPITEAGIADSVQTGKIIRKYIDEEKKDYSKLIMDQIDFYSNE